jgi:hypothetical protein
MLLALFTFELFLLGLVWAVMVLLNVWLYQKSKAQGNLLMLIGAGLLAFVSLLSGFGANLGMFVWGWFPIFGAVLVVAGFYLTVKTLVAANIAALKEKAQHAMHKGGEGGKPGGGTPPSGT